MNVGLPTFSVQINEPIIDSEGIIYYVRAASYLRALNVTTNEVEWEITVPSAEVSPALSDGHLCILMTNYIQIVEIVLIIDCYSIATESPIQSQC
jgi:hypothetical protein